MLEIIRCATKQELHIVCVDGSTSFNSNVLEMKCLRSLVLVLLLDTVGNENERTRAVIDRELASGSESIEMVWTRGENG